MDISPVLHTHDVLSIIFHHLRPAIDACPLSGDIVDQRRALVALALTSKLLSEYALDTLWKCLTYERPLLVLLKALRSTKKLPQPKSLLQGGWDLAASVPFLVCLYNLLWYFFAHHVFRFKATDWTMQQWNRFCTYSRRVRNITLNPFTADGFLSVWCELAHPYATQTSIFPCLHTVVIEGTYDGRVDHSGVLWSIIPTGIQTLKFHVQSGKYKMEEEARRAEAKVILDIFHRICTHTEDVESVDIRMPSYAPFDLSILRYPHLRSISVKDFALPVEQLRSLLRNRNTLKALSFEILDTTGTCPIGFVALENITLSGSWKAVGTALGALSAPGVHSLALNPVHPEAHADEVGNYAPACLSGVTYRRFPRLFNLNVCAHFKGPEYYRMPRKISSSFTALFQPLFSLHGLRNVTITFSGYVELHCSTEEFVPLAKAWPQLERLTLRKGTEGKSAAFIATLMAFAENCPHLKELSLPWMQYDASAVAPAEDYCTAREKAHGLEALTVMDIDGLWNWGGNPSVMVHTPEDIVSKLFPSAKFWMVLDVRRRMGN